MRRRDFIGVPAVLLAGAVPISALRAQEDYPSKPIRFVIPSAPGSAVNTGSDFPKTADRKFLTPGAYRCSTGS